jgi:multidrug transporter EmrE-like cation transporter
MPTGVGGFTETQWVVTYGLIALAGGFALAFEELHGLLGMVVAGAVGTTLLSVVLTQSPVEYRGTIFVAAVIAGLAGLGVGAIINHGRQKMRP